MKTILFSLFLVLSGTLVAQSNNDTNSEIERLRAEMEAKKLEMRQEIDRMKSTLEKDKRMQFGAMDKAMEDAKTEMQQMRSRMEKEMKMQFGQMNNNFDEDLDIEEEAGE